MYMNAYTWRILLLVADVDLVVVFVFVVVIGGFFFVCVCLCVESVLFLYLSGPTAGVLSGILTKS